MRDNCYISLPSLCVSVFLPCVLIQILGSETAYVPAIVLVPLTACGAWHLAQLGVRTDDTMELEFASPCMPKPLQVLRVPKPEKKKGKGKGKGGKKKKK